MMSDSTEYEIARANFRCSSRHVRSRSLNRENRGCQAKPRQRASGSQTARQHLQGASGANDEPRKVRKLAKSSHLQKTLKVGEQKHVVCREVAPICSMER